MKVYHHARIETYPNDESQAKLALLLEAVAAVLTVVVIIAAIV